MQNRNPQTVLQETGINNTDVTTWALPEGAIARLGRGIVGPLAFSPDGKYLAVGTKIGLWWYELATMKPGALWETERGMLSALKFSSDGALLATGNSDGGIKIWDVQNHRCLMEKQRMGRSDRASVLVFSPDGQCLASSGGRYDAVYVWHLETSEQVAKFTVDEELQPPRYRPPVIPLAFSPDGKSLIGATPENTFSVWDIETGERRAHLTGHSAIVIYLLFSPCGEFLTSVDWDGGLHKWEVDKLTTKDPQPLITSMPEVTKSVDYTYSADGVLLAATASGMTITVWDVERNRKVATLTHKEIIWRFHFSQTGSQLVIGGTDTFQTWNIGDPAPQPPAIRDHYSVCSSVKFSPDGQTLAAGYWSGEIHLRDAQELELQTIFRCEGTIRSIDFSPCGNKLAATSSDKIVRVWDLKEPEAPPIELTGHQASLYAVAFSPKGNLLVSADLNGVLGVWDVEHDYELQMFTEETDWIWSIAFSPDGKHLVSAHEKEKAQLWDIESGAQITELSSNLPRDATKYKGNDHQIQRKLRRLEKGLEDKRTPKAIAFSPDGNLIAGDVLGEIRLWDTTTYEIRMVIFLPFGCGRAEALTFSPCGRYLASGASWLAGTDKVSIRLWEVTTGENIATFWSHPTDIQSLAFSPDSTLLASGSYDGTILLWDMKPYLFPINAH